MMTPILLLEINEVPWRLVDRYIGRPEFANIRRFFERSEERRVGKECRL